MATLVPAVIPQSREHLMRTCELLFSFSPEIQIDIVDGIFVPFTSWPITPRGDVADLREVTKKGIVEVDLMVREPEKVAHSYISSGVQNIVLHDEAIRDVDALARLRHEPFVRIGIAVGNSSPLTLLDSFVMHADYVQLMGIAKIGVQGQPFDGRVLERIGNVRRMYPGVSISIDGSVNADTIPMLKEAGADRMVSGSAILGADSPSDAYTALNTIIA